MFTNLIRVLLLSAYLVVPSLNQVTTTSTQTIPYIHDSAYSTLSSECQSIITVCKPTVLSCAVSLCSICTSLGVTPSIEPCCAAPTPLACFSDYVAGDSITYPTPTGPTGPESTITSFDSSALACASIYSISSTCAASTPNWDQLEFSSQFSCACFTNGTLAPTIWDGYWSTCLAWLSTASPSEYSLLGPTGGGNAARTPCELYLSSSAAFPTTSLPPTPGTSATGPVSTKIGQGSRLMTQPVSSPIRALDELERPSDIKSRRTCGSL